jgi:hypothetical protein
MSLPCSYSGKRLTFTSGAGVAGWFMGQFHFKDHYHNGNRLFLMSK